MSFAKFELRDMLTCAATDDEGFRCIHSPNHKGAHEWGRCAHVDDGGHRCFMPPRHPGGHVLPWFDSPAHEGDHHTLRYEGSEDACQRDALRDMPMFQRYGWAACDTTFTPWLPWRWRPLARVMAALLLAPRGSLQIVYEFGPREAESPSED
jgi:hypothetical protein